jgi:hypothetical protein
MDNAALGKKSARVFSSDCNQERGSEAAAAAARLAVNE